jgi:hypothetical protein
MRNKVEIRAFAVEQVIKMRCMSDCTIEDVVEQAKLIETYVVGEANIPECVDDISSLINAMAGSIQRVNADLKPNEA